MTTTSFSQIGDADFQAAMQKLLPRGRAWPRTPTALLTAFAGAIGDAFFALRQVTVQFLDVESDPSQALALLPDWETDFGLPDSCSPPNPTLQQRHNSLLLKIAASPGGQSAAYYIGVAAQFGYVITITTWRVSCLGQMHLGDPMCAAPWRFAWRVNVPSISVEYFSLGVSALGEPFWTTSDTELECRLAKIQPAYGVLWFSFGTLFAGDGVLDFSLAADSDLIPVL